MQSLNGDNDPHIDWSKFGKKTRDQINAEAAAEKATLGLLGSRKHVVANINGARYIVGEK